MRVKPLRIGNSKQWHWGNGKLFSNPKEFGPICGERAADNRGVTTERRYLTCPKCIEIVK